MLRMKTVIIIALAWGGLVGERASALNVPLPKSRPAMFLAWARANSATWRPAIARGSIGHWESFVRDGNLFIEDDETGLAIDIEPFKSQVLKVCPEDSRCLIAGILAGWRGTQAFVKIKSVKSMP